MGFVGTPQVYGNQRQSFVARGAAQQLFMFYGSIMRGLAGRGSANMIGANHVVRVRALREVKFYAGHLTEDLLTGMRMHARGLEEPVRAGAARRRRRPERPGSRTSTSRCAGRSGAWTSFAATR